MWIDNEMVLIFLWTMKVFDSLDSNSIDSKLRCIPKKERSTKYMCSNIRGQASTNPKNAFRNYMKIYA